MLSLLLLLLIYIQRFLKEHLFSSRTSSLRFFEQLFGFSFYFRRFARGDFLRPLGFDFNITISRFLI